MGLAKPAWPVLQSGLSLRGGLALAWPLYEGSGPNVNDLSGNGFIGTFNGNWTGGPSGTATHTDGSTTDIHIFSSSAAPPAPNIQTGDLTVAVRVLVAALGSYTPAFDAYDQVLNRMFSLFLNAGGGTSNVYWACGGAVGQDGISISQSLSANTRYDLVVTRKGTLSSFYINGALAGTDSTQTNTNPWSGAGTSKTLSLGLNPSTGGTKEPSTYDYFALWSRALSAAEVAQLYFDPFAIYRSRTRFAQFVSASAPPAACAPTLSLLGVGCGIQAARAMIRNRVVGRRGVVAELLGVNDE